MKRDTIATLLLPNKEQAQSTRWQQRHRATQVAEPTDLNTAMRKRWSLHKIHAQGTALEVFQIQQSDDTNRALKQTNKTGTTS